LQIIKLTVRHKISFSGKSDSKKQRATSSSDLK